MSFYDKIVRPTTQMLLKRMDTNPEEFDSSGGSLIGSRTWLAIAKHGSFNWYERSLINKKTKALQRKATEQAILGLLLDGQARQEEEDSDLNIYQHTTVGRFSVSIEKQEQIAERLKKNLAHSLTHTKETLAATIFSAQQNKQRVRKV